MILRFLSSYCKTKDLHVHWLGLKRDVGYQATLRVRLRWVHRFTKWAAMHRLMDGSFDYSTNSYLIQTFIVRSASFSGFFAYNFVMGQTTLCRVVACAVSEIKCYHCFTSDLGSGIIILYNYSLLSMPFADIHVIGLICYQDIVLVGIISLGAALWDWGIRGFLVVRAGR